MSAARCPHCGALCLTIRQPRRNAHPKTRASFSNPQHYALLDLEPIKVRVVPDSLLIATGITPPVGPVVVFSTDGESGARAFADAWADDTSQMVGHKVHRFGCPDWPAASKTAPIRRYDDHPKKEQQP